MNIASNKAVFSVNNDGLQAGEGEGERKSKAQGVDRELNLKGKVCPYTFIESMLALEEMKMGEVLRVIVDYPPAVCDVPKSLKNEGYEILDVSPINGTDWVIVVKNTEFKEGNE